MLTIEQRRESGIFYTPEPVAHYILKQVLSFHCSQRSTDIPHILDPACGKGVFLCEAFKLLLKRQRDSGSDVAAVDLLSQIWGVDIDHGAVRVAIEGLAELAGGTTSDAEPQIAWGDALVSRRFSRQGGAPALRWGKRFPRPIERGGFDIIVGNPPYLNIRRLARSSPHLRSYLRENFQCARGAFDLYILFLEQAYRLLRPGGVCGMIVPNKIATMDYALACRRLLLKETTLLQITDVSHLKLFHQASVYPHILLWRKEPAASRHQISVRVPKSVAALATTNDMHRVLQRSMDPERGLTWRGELDVESRVRTCELQERCRLHSGTTGFVARQLADELFDGKAAPPNNYFEFIVSGNIDRYKIELGNVRFMKRVFQRPRLLATSPRLSERKRDLFRSSKIVIAGMTRRLEAAWDPGGLSLGVQVFAASEIQVEPRFLLGILNSKFLSYLFRLRFQAKRLAGDYLAINLGQLARLPISIVDQQQTQRLGELVGRRLSLAEEARHDVNRIENEIDQLVYQCYELTSREIAQVEAAIV
jgi:SAM-dependent methyltransferase